MRLYTTLLPNHMSYQSQKNHQFTKVSFTQKSPAVIFSKNLYLRISTEQPTPDPTKRKKKITQQANVFAWGKILSFY